MKKSIISMLIIVTAVLAVRYIFMNHKNFFKSLQMPGATNNFLRDKNENINSDLINVYNRLSKDAARYYTFYGNSIDWEKGPASNDIKSEIHTELISSNDDQFYHDITDKLKSFTDEKKDSIAQVTKGYINAFYALEKEAKLIDDYYNHKEYKDDNFKKGSEMHETFKKLFEEYWNQEDRITKYLDIQEDIELNKQINEAKKTSELEYDYLSVLGSSKKILKASSQVSSKEGFKSFQSLNDQYESEFNALKSEFEKDQLKMNASHGDQQTLAGELVNFISGCDQLLIENKTLIRKILTPEKENKNLPDILKDLKEKYNDVVERSNELGTYMTSSSNSVWVVK